MSENEPSIFKSAIKYGFLMAAALIAYFLVMKLLGLHVIVELRMFNVVILMGMILLAIRNITRVKGGVHATFLEGFGAGSLTAIIGVTAFAFFLVIYLSFLDPGFMTYVQENEAFGDFLNPITVAFAIMIEGIGSGVILTFILMQYLKNKVNA